MILLQGIVAIAWKLSRKSHPTALVRSYPVWNDSLLLDTICEEAEAAPALRRLGTVHEALGTLKEFDTIFKDKITSIALPFSGKKYIAETYSLRVQLNKLLPWHIVGDTRNVNHLYCKKLPVGYVIETDQQSGLQKEVIEGMTRKVTVLRRHGEIIAACPSLVIREDYGRGGYIM